MIGDQGFDPLGITNTIPSLNYVRAAELKHGRVAMLAVLGWLTQEKFHPLYGGKLSGNPLKAFGEVPPLAFVQIIAFCGLLEYAFTQASKGDGYKAGDYYGISTRFEDPASRHGLDSRQENLTTAD